MSCQALSSSGVSLTVASTTLRRMAPRQAPSSEPRPPTAAQTTIETEKEMFMKVGEANSAAITNSMPARPAIAAEATKNRIW